MERLGERLVEWAERRPAWQQDALRRVAEGGLGEKDEEALLLMLKADRGLRVEGGIAPVPLAPEHLPAATPALERLRLLDITEIEDVNHLVASGKISFAPDGLTVIYTFNPNSHQMVRDASDGSHQVLLTNCNLLNFDLRQRNPTSKVYVD